MKKNLLLHAAILCATVLSAQPSFQTTLQTGISLPLNSNNINNTHAGYGIHFGNHLDYTFGNNSVRFGIGAYIGFLNTFGTNDKYKQTGQQIAQKFNMQSSQLVFNESAFKSTQLLLGPVLSFKSNNWSIDFWAKGGYGLNEPGRYSVQSRENGTVNNIYVNQNSENKNGLAYNVGAGLQYIISYYVGLQLSAGYFGTQTEQVNYNFEREKGLAPLYYNAKNNFIQASVGFRFTIGKENSTEHNTRASINTTRSNIKHQFFSTNDYGATERPDQKIKTKSNIKNDRAINNSGNAAADEEGGIAQRPDQKIKTKSNIKNDRLISNNGYTADPEADSLFFIPSKIEIRNERPMPKGEFAEMSRQSLAAVNSYLTGFAYQGQNGAVLNQCGSSAMAGEPIPGVDVRLRRMGDAGNNVLTARTNKDGSFSFNNIEPGNYNAEVGSSKMDVVVTGNNDNAYSILDMNSESCNNTKENFVISIDDKLYVEVITAREASSGMATGRVLPTVNKKEIAIDEAGVQKPRDVSSGLATGKRMHKPFRVSDTEFDLNWNNIIIYDGKLYAEVMSSREASSGMASGRSVLITGDVDGDGFTELQVTAPRDVANGLATGKRMHKPFIVVYDSEDDINNYEIIDPRDAATGLATGKRMHKPFVITKELDVTDNEMVLPRDAATGLATGKRMHKPFVITKELDVTGNEMVSPRDAATGLATGRRMHKPFVVVYDAEDDADSYEVVTGREASSGMATGKRMHKPFVITKELDVSDNEIVSPRDAASGLSTGKRMHKPFVMMLDDEDAGDYEVVSPRDIATGQSSGRRQHQPISFVYDGVTYNIIHRDIAARNTLSNDAGTEKMAITEQGLPKKKGSKKAVESYDPWNTDDADNDVVSNPLYQGGNTSGVNPLFEAKDALRVSGSNGKDHAIFIPSVLSINQNSSTAALPFTEYQLAPIKWMAPESIASRKGITEKGIKKNETNERKGWDGTVKGGSKNINTSEPGLGGGHDKINDVVAGNDAAKGINEAGIKKNETNERKGWDGTVKGGSKNINTSESGLGGGHDKINDVVAGNDAAKGINEAGIKKNEIAIGEISRLRCSDGSCSIETTVSIDGKEYEAVVTGVLKTRHDTVKNSINNVR